ncbi:MAG: hypothetical protein M3O50_19565 [Myxococcota bacterium]|nr:hypothetical protein [Myxococcota bacterium]
MNLDANYLILSLLIGSVGFVCFAFGKRQARLPPMIAGAILMVYPYFVTNLFGMVAVGIGVLGLLWAAVRLGA